MTEKLNKAILKYFSFRKKYISLGINSLEKNQSQKIRSGSGCFGQL